MFEFESIQVRLEIGNAAPPRTVLRVHRHPMLRVALGYLPEHASVLLASATSMHDVTGYARRGAIPVPPDRECVIRLVDSYPEGPLHTFVARIPAARGPQAPPLLLRWPAPVQVHARFRDPEGRPVRAWLLDYVQAPDEGGILDSWAPYEPPSPAAVLPTYAEGELRILAVPEGRALAARWTTVRIPAGASDGAIVDAGEIAFGPRGDSRLTVTLPGGVPLAKADLRVVRAEGGGAAAADAKGVFDPDLVPLAAGDVVELVPSESRAPVRLTLAGPGPWTLAVPATSIEAAVADDDGNEIRSDFAVVVDGRVYGRQVTGLVPGPHRVAVAAEGRITRLYRVVLKEGEKRRIEARLRPAPPPPK